MTFLHSGSRVINLSHITHAQYVPVGEDDYNAIITCILSFVDGSQLRLEGDEGDRVWAQLELLSSFSADLSRQSSRKLVEAGQ